MIVGVAEGDSPGLLRSGLMFAAVAAFLNGNAIAKGLNRGPVILPNGGISRGLFYEYRCGELEGPNGTP